jgi:DNA-binding transcriptional LysR family regulator
VKVQTNQLDALRWIARLGSFRAAATRLHVSQPTISMRIQELERLLGATLFDRSGQRAVLTEAGRDLVRYAERIVTLAEEMEQRSAGAMAIETSLRMGAADTFALTCLSSLVAEIEQRFPTLRVDLQIDYSFNLHRGLQKGELDIGFLTGPIDEASMRVEHLVRLPLAWVASPRLGLPSRVLEPRDLLRTPIICNPAPSHLYRAVHEWFAAGDCVPERITTCNSMTIMTRLAAVGFGVAILPTSVLRNEFELGALRPLRTDPAAGTHDLLFAHLASLSPVIVNAVRDIATQLVRTSDLLKG